MEREQPQLELRKLLVTMNFLTSLSKEFSGEDSAMAKFSFQYRVQLRRSWKQKSTLYGELLDFDKDFKVPEDYNGPRLTSNEVTPEFVEHLRVHFAKEQQIHRKYIYLLLSLSEIYFHTQPTLVDIAVPKDAVINICGDIHGQYYDMLKIFKERGPPSPSNLYLFNGDIVDKGPMSLECMLLLLASKLAFPRCVFVNRGNHESDFINARDGFAREISTKTGGDHFMFQFFGEVFRWLPLAHLINSRVLVVHGGLSAKKDLRLDDIKKLTRPVEPHSNRLAGELLWSDPISRPGTLVSSRGIGVFFGPDVTKAFLESNDLLCVIRSHSEIREGCGLNHQGCYTVYSAPNRAKEILGGVMTLKGQYLDKEGQVFQECTQQEIEEFKQGNFWHEEEMDREDSG